MRTKKDHRSKGIERKKERKKHAREKTVSIYWRPVLLFFLWISLGGVSLYLFLWSPYLLLQTIIVTGNDKIAADEIVTYAESLVEGENSWGVHNQHYFLYPVNTVKEKILEEFFLLQDVTVVKRFPQTIAISVSEIDEIMIICLPQENSRGECNEVDHESKFGQSVDLTHPRYKENRVIIIDAIEGSSYAVGDELFDASARTFLPAFEEELLFRLGIRTVGRYARSTAAREDFSIMTDEGWLLRFDATDSLDNVLNRLSVLFERTELRSSRSEVEYIDVRFEDRIFYKKLDASPDQELLIEEGATI